MEKLENTLDRNSPDPLYLQLYAILKEYIKGGRLPANGKLPREIDLCEFFGVGNNTVRQALAMLEDERLIVRIKRRGTFAASRISAFDPQNPLRNLAVVFPRNTWNILIMEMKREIENAGFNFLGGEYKLMDLDDEIKTLRRVMKNSAGIILYPHLTGMDKDIIAEIDASGHPLVLFDMSPEISQFNSVSIDHLLGSCHITEILLSLGKRRIGIVHSDIDFMSARLRVSGYRLAHAIHKVPENRKLTHAWSTHRKFIEYLDSVQPDALFFCHIGGSSMLRGIASRETGKILSSRGIKTVTWGKYKFLDEHYAAYAEQPYEDLGQTAISLLLDVLNNNTLNKRRYLIAPRITTCMGAEENKNAGIAVNFSP